MATTEQADIMPVGVVYEEPERGSYVKNCYSLPPDTWKVREGFGRVYSHNTSYNLLSKNISLNPEKTGYYKQLGSCSFTTSYGNRQILSLFIAQISILNRDGADGFTDVGKGNVYSLNDDFVVIPEHTYQYVVVIYDIDTNRHYEQVIGGKTSEIDDFIPMEQQFGFYDRDLTQQTHTKVFPINTEVDDPFYWAELNSPTLGDVIYFGTSQLGLYAYRPVVFDAPPDNQVETTFLGAYSYTLGGMTGRNGWSETGFIEKCSAGEGLLVGGFVYLNQSEFPVPTDITAINNRIVMAYGRNIYFSDTFNGSAIIADNILSVPTDNPITAISEINGVLLIFTNSETFMYQPSVGSEIQTSGRTIKLNSNFGCLNSQAKMKVENLLYFCDATGIYVSDGSTLKDIADPIRPLFRRFIEEPLTYYDRDSEKGKTNFVNQPKIYYDWKKLKGLHFAKNPLNSLVYVVVPEQKMAWVIDQNKMFSIWSWDTTITQKETPETWNFQQFSKLENGFRLVDNGDDLFIVNLEQQLQESAAFPLNDVEAPLTYYNKTNNIYRWKTAGGTDFSISYHEDKKVYQKSAVILNEPETKDFQIVVGKPVEIYDGIFGDNGNIYAFNNAPIDNTPLYAVPVGIANLTQTEGISQFQIELEWNDTYWDIETFTNAGFANYCSVIWHPNRLASAPNFGWIIPVIATNVIYASVGTLLIKYDGSVSPTYFGNYLNVLNQVQPLFWLIMRQKPAFTNSTMGIGWQLNSVEVNGTPNNCVVIAEEFGGQERDWATKRVEDITLRQGSYPIEWILQSTPQQGEKGELLKVRGGYLNVFSNGPFPNVANDGASDYVSDRGLINAMITTDYNNYQGQVIDWTMTPPSINDGLVDTQYGLVNVLDVSQGEFTNAVNQNQPKIFGNPSATYANQSYVPPQTLGGTILIDGEDYYPTSFSTGTKGTSFYITLYGYCQSIATKLLINNLTSAFRVVSDARRRWKSDRGAQ